MRRTRAAPKDPNGVDRPCLAWVVRVGTVRGVALEYEAVCRNPAQRIASGLAETEVETIVTALCAVAEPVATRFLWRPQLHDPGDEMVLDAAINGAADALVTFNRQDFGAAGVALLSPGEALRRLSS